MATAQFRGWLIDALDSERFTYINRDMAALRGAA